MVILFIEIFYNWINLFEIENGFIYCWGYNYHGQLGIGNNSNQNKPIKYLNDKYKFIFICGGYCHTIGLTGNLIYFSIYWIIFRKWSII